jgi:hypothetical protein
MIRIGLDSSQKQIEIERYLSAHPEINRIFAFYFKKFPISLQLPEDIAVEYVEYADIIEYEYFYRLLEIIDKDTLLIFNECLRTQKRSDLTYNCAHHYANQTRHVIVFEYFPFIENPSDFLILLDYQTPGKYKGRSFNYQFLHDEDVSCLPHDLMIRSIDCYVSSKDVARYERKKEQLFDSLDQGDPDTIPRQLHIFAGNFKKSVIDNPSHCYVARNDRFKMPNIITYKEIVEEGEFIIVDFPHRRIDFNDFLKIAGMHDVQFVNSGLKVDNYYLGELCKWNERLGEFYAQAGVYR